MENEEVAKLVICVDKDMEHIEESILTNCSECNKQIWCSITNCAVKPICMKCIVKLKGENVQMMLTTESLLEAIKHILTWHSNIRWVDDDSNSY